MAIFDKTGLLQKLVQKIRSNGIGGLTRAVDVRQFLTDLIDTMFSLAGQSSSADADLEWKADAIYNLTDNKFAIYNQRIFESKTDANTGNLPPSVQDVNGNFENTYWIEVSPAPASGIVAWAAGVYGKGLKIVFHNKLLYELIVPDAQRPFKSTDITAEITALKWEAIGGGGSGGGAALATMAEEEAGTTVEKASTPGGRSSWWIKVLDGTVASYFTVKVSALKIELGNSVATGVARVIEAMGSAADIYISLKPKGAGKVKLEGASYVVSGEKALIINLAGEVIAQYDVTEEQVAVPTSLSTGGVPGTWAREAGFLYFCYGAGWEKFASVSSALSYGEYSTAVPVSAISPAGAFVGQVAYDTANNKKYEWTGSEWVWTSINPF